MLRSSATATMRTSEAERQRVADFLRDACADGRLSPDELDGRLDRLFASRTVADLDPLVWDLPGAHGVLPGAPVAPARRARPVAERAGFALLGLGVAIFMLTSLPDFLAWALVAIGLSIVVTTLVLATALAPAGLVLFGLAWLAARLWRDRLGAPPERRRLT